MTLVRKPQAGFSLLEVLIAIAILAGIAMAMGPAISAAARASSRIHQSAASEEDLRSARQFFNDIIVQQVFLGGAYPEDVVAGDAFSMTLITLDPGDMSPVAVQLTITRETPATLVASFGNTDSENTETYTLLSNISDARFEFMKDNNWRNVWRDAKPPALIRLTGILNGKGENRAFIFEAAPQGAAPLHCQFDPVSRRCR